MSVTPMRFVAIAAFTLFAAIGCRPDVEANPPDTSTHSAPPDVAAEKLELTLYSGRSEALVAPLIEKFEAASGATVKVKYGDSGELVGTLLEEGEKSPADVFWAQDAGTLGVLSAKGMLAKLPTELTTSVDGVFKSPTDEWVATSGRARVLVYNTKKLQPEDLPKSAAELTDPKWKGRVGWAPENASFQAFVAAMVELDGAEATTKWIADMTANEPKAYPKNTPAVAATASGEVDVALVNHYYLYRLKKENGPDYPVENHFFGSEKADSLVNVSGVSQLKSSAHSEAAQKFIAYLLSEDAQKYFASETYEYPVIHSVPPYEGLPPLKTLKPPKVNFAKLANLEVTVDLLRNAKALP